MGENAPRLEYGSSISDSGWENHIYNENTPKKLFLDIPEIKILISLIHLMTVIIDDVCSKYEKNICDNCDDKENDTIRLMPKNLNSEFFGFEKLHFFCIVHLGMLCSV